MKPIRLSGHTQGQLAYRGTNEHEIVDAIQTSSWEPADLGRLECRKDLPFGREWNGKMYETKQVRPIFVQETGEIVVVTVYTYYF